MKETDSTFRLRVLGRRSRLALLAALWLSGLLLLSCSGEREERAAVSPLEEALRQAGDNRAELEKALRRYRANLADSLKYRAACFLIENMPGYVYYKGELLERYLTYYRMLAENRDKEVTPKMLADSTRKMYGPFSLDSLERYEDIRTVDSAYLCDNIDRAFRVWREQPWGARVTFADFCEYVLPYRIGDETLCRWREELYRTYNPMLDSLRASSTLDREDPAVAARVLLDSLRGGRVVFTTAVPGGLPHVGPATARLKAGSCREFTDFTVYVCRALGIPCAVDFMPLRGDENDSHQWVSVADKYGALYYEEFPDPMKEVRKDKMLTMPKIKVYRNTFSLNREMEEAMSRLDTAVVPFFRHPRFADVTFSYTEAFSKRLEIPSSALYPGAPRSRVAYLCASRGMEWEPMAWAEFGDGPLVFADIQKGPVARVATYERGGLRFWTDPFEVSVSGKFRFFTPSDSALDVTLFAKYTLRAEGMFQERMVGGRFEGSDNPSFAPAETLHVIDAQPGRLQTVVSLRSPRSCRYVRYVGPEGSHCNIAEAAFYSPSDTAALKGRVIGTPGCYQKDGSHEYTNVFDGNLWTSFDYLEPSGGWSGLDLGASKPIGKIVYTPRSYDNYVRPGDKYELFYCAGRDGWKSLGKQTAEADSLSYKEVPGNVLLLLRNHTRGNQERIFTYEDGRQVWK